MTRRFGFLLALALAACGPDDHLKVAGDAGVGSDAPDGGTTPTTLTSYVIDLITNHSGDTAPAAYATFSGLPDPDGDSNNTTAYSSLFP